MNDIFQYNELSMDELERCFKEAIKLNKRYIGILVSTEGYPANELIVNGSNNFRSKITYYKKAYNNELHLKNANFIKIIGFTYADSLETFQNHYRNLI